MNAPDERPTQQTALEVPILFQATEERQIDERLARRESLFDPDLIGSVHALFERVRLTGDRALLEATQEHDGVQLQSSVIPAAVVESAAQALPTELRAAIDVSRARIARVNEHCLTSDRIVEMEPGVRVGELFRPLDSVALWVPCRKGPLLSTALMLTCAARAAGVRRIVLMMPPRADGSADPGTLAAGFLAGATEFQLGNGVALIAAATHGTASVQRVDGVFGPGPGGIAVAMGMAGMYGLKTVVGIGPTDCAVLADDSADARLIAWDLASEAEHGPDSAALLVTPFEPLARAVAAHLSEIIAASPALRRANLERVFGSAGRGMLVVCPNFDAACALTARFAPEHLSIVCRAELRELALSSAVAGEVLIGESTPFAAANYAIGITAVLPTNGAARSISGITARDMRRIMTFAELAPGALELLGPTIQVLADYEGLPNHAAAAKARYPERAKRALNPGQINM